MSPTSCKLSPQQVRVLQVLSQYPNGLSRSECLRQAGASSAVDVLGYAKDWIPENGTQVGDSLMGLRYIREYNVDVDGRSERFYTLTDNGFKASQEYLALPRRDKDARVETGLLDAIVKRLRTKIAYGLERWTDTDIEMVRDMLGDGYEEIDIVDLRVQITNRRKQGAYADPSKKEITSLQKLLREFGPEGTVIEALLTDEQVKRVRQRLTRLMNESK